MTRLSLALFSRLCNWREAVVRLRPSTIICWHRLGWRIFWHLKCRAGRPPIPLELRMLIRRMARENPLWGQERIAYELLLKLGIRVSPRTVAKYMPNPQPGGSRRSTLVDVPEESREGDCRLRLLRLSDGDLPGAVRIHRDRAWAASPRACERDRQSHCGLDAAATARGRRGRGHSSLPDP